MGILLQLGFPMLVIALLLLLSHPGLTCGGFTFHLERAFPVKHINVTHHVIRDKARLGRLLHGPIDFPVGGDSYQTGLYYSKVSLGTPPKDFYVQIDTGSQMMWVSCKSCKNCPTTSPIQDISLDFFDPIKSSTSSLITCHDERCRLGFPDSSNCSTDTQRCIYSIEYYDNSGTSGFYVSDLLHSNTRAESSQSSNHYSTPVVFGCSNVQKGNLAEPVQLVDGIFGFGQHGLSVISQLAAHGDSQKVFSHCLSGDTDGGGVLVIGEIIEPGMIFSPLIPKMNFYSSKLRSISVNGKILPVDPTVFSNSPNPGAIFDTGTTLAYLPDEVYQHFISVINNFVKEVTFVVPQCYSINSRVSNVFPLVNLIFEGGAVLILSPEDYLLPDSSSEDNRIWCMGFKSGLYTVLGDLVLKNKIVVYDLVNQMIGWKNYDCSKAVNASANTRDLQSDARPRVPKFTLWTIAFVTCLSFFLMS